MLSWGRPAVWITLCILLPSLAQGFASLDEVELSPCDISQASSSIPWVGVPANGYAVYEFTLERDSTAAFQLGIASRSGKDPAASAHISPDSAAWHRAERHLAAAFILDESGRLITWGELGTPNEGYQLDSSSSTNHRIPRDDHGCGWTATLFRASLEAGTYSAVVISSSEHGGQAGFSLGYLAPLVPVEQGPAQRVSEHDLICEHASRTNVRGQVTEELRSCRLDFQLEGRAFWLLAMGRKPDGNHQVFRVDANGDRHGIVHYGLGWKMRGSGGIGTPDDIAALEVPIYHTPLGYDPGIFGVVAGIRAPS